jgi:hypothetical protein
MSTTKSNTVLVSHNQIFSHFFQMLEIQAIKHFPHTFLACNRQNGTWMFDFEMFLTDFSGNSIDIEQKMIRLEITIIV